MSENYDPPLVHLPGTKLTPEVVLHRTLNKKHRIKAVVVVIQWDDESFVTDHSQMQVGELAIAARVLDRTADRIVFKEDPDAIYSPPAPSGRRFLTRPHPSRMYARRVRLLKWKASRAGR